MYIYECLTMRIYILIYIEEERERENNMSIKFIDGWVEDLLLVLLLCRDLTSIKLI